MRLERVVVVADADAADWAPAAAWFWSSSATPPLLLFTTGCYCRIGMRVISMSELGRYVFSGSLPYLHTLTLP